MSTKRASTLLIIVSLALSVVIAASDDPAHARGSDGLLTFGVGGGVGVLRTTQPGQPATSTVTKGVGVRLKALWVLGLDWSVGFSSDAPAATKRPQLQFHTNTRLTGLLYVVPTRKVSLYLAAGIGGSNIAELFTIRGDTNAYHGGAGLEWHMTQHITLDASFLVIVPGIASIERSQNYMNELLAMTEGDTGGVGFGYGDTQLEVDEPTLGDYVNIKNFEVMFRLYFFM